MIREQVLEAVKVRRDGPRAPRQAWSCRIRRAQVLTRTVEELDIADAVGPGRVNVWTIGLTRYGAWRPQLSRN